MNSYQKVVAILYVMILLAIVTYVPFHVVQSDTGIVVYSGYEFIFSVSRVASLNVSMLFFELLIASIIAAVSYFVLKDK